MYSFSSLIASFMMSAQVSAAPMPPPKPPPEKPPYHAILPRVIHEEAQQTPVV